MIVNIYCIWNWMYAWKPNINRMNNPKWKRNMWNQSFHCCYRCIANNTQKIKYPFLMVENVCWRFSGFILHVEFLVISWLTRDCVVRYIQSVECKNCVPTLELIKIMRFNRPFALHHAFSNANFILA